MERESDALLLTPQQMERVKKFVAQKLQEKEFSGGVPNSTCLANEQGPVQGEIANIEVADFTLGEPQASAES